jgi:hypothetical protein
MKSVLGPLVCITECWKWVSQSVTARARNLGGPGSFHVRATVGRTEVAFKCYTMMKAQKFDAECLALPLRIL